MRGLDLEDLAPRYALTEGEAATLTAFDELFLRTVEHTNLVARSTLADRATRHYEDALQLWPLLPPYVGSLLDVGSGGGFPGVVLACLARFRRPGMRVVLCDSVTKKAGFLSEAVDALGLTNTTVTASRAEALTERFDVVTARAVTALPRLLTLTVPRLNEGGTLVLPKGRNADQELERAREEWRLTTERVGSRTDPDATILVITDPERRS